jgi:hypothetical protein
MRLRGAGHPSADDLAAHAIGGLDGREERRVARHASRCERCRDELARLAPAVAVLAESVEQHPPPSGLRHRLLAEVRAGVDAEREGPPQRSRPDRLRGFLFRPAAGLAAAALVGAGVTGYLIADVGGDGSSSSPASSVVSGADATLETTDETATLELRGMPQLPEGAVYQVWVVREEASGASSVQRSAAFVPAGDGSATAAVPEALEGPAKLMVTEEPSPGRDEPSGPPLLTVEVG